MPCPPGVVRRHPDIKWLRRDTDIAQFAAQRGPNPDAFWHALAAGSTMLLTSPARFSMKRTPGRSTDCFSARHPRNVCPSRSPDSNWLPMPNMTVSITRCFASRSERLLPRWLLTADGVLAFAAHADEGVIRSAEIVPGDGGCCVLNADIDRSGIRA